MKTSKGCYFDINDLKHLAKNTVIFFGPSLLWGAMLIQGGEFTRQQFLIGAAPTSILSVVIKGFEYWYTNNKTHE